MSESKVSWGKMLGGATIAAGAVAAAVFVPEAAAEISGATKAALIGVGALLGALITKWSGEAKHESRETKEASRMRFEDESFATRLEIERMEALMRGRLAAVGYQVPPEARGRG